MITPAQYGVAFCLFWTRAAFVHPLADFSDELCVDERRRASPFAGIPTPQHEWVVETLYASRKAARAPALSRDIAAPPSELPATASTNKTGRHPSKHNLICRIRGPLS